MKTKPVPTARPKMPQESFPPQSTAPKGRRRLQGGNREHNRLDRRDKRAKLSLPQGHDRFCQGSCRKIGSYSANADLLKTAEEQYNSLANAGKPGDTDGDGEITVTDALLTLQGSVGKITLSPEAQGRADVDGDGKITVTDALLILQRAVKKIEKFPPRSDIIYTNWAMPTRHGSVFSYFCKKNHILF